MRSVLLSAAVLTIATASARAQDSTATVPVNCDSAIASARVDSVSVGIFFSVDRLDDELAPAHGTIIATAVATALRLPAPWRAEVFDGPPQMRALRRIGTGAGGELRAPSITGVYRYTATRDQPVKHAEVVRASLVGGLDSAMLAAIREASVIREVAQLREGEDSMRVQVRVSTDSGPTSHRLMTLEFPRMRVVDAVPARGNPPAALPEELRGASFQEEVLLRFVVDRQGLPDLSTVELARGRSGPLIRAALQALTAQFFTPASVAGCAVSQVVYYPFSFHSEAEKPPLRH
jgi:hypothetical protein